MAADRDQLGEAKADKYNERGEAFETMILTALRTIFDAQRLSLIEGAQTKNLSGYATKSHTKSMKKEFLADLTDWDEWDDEMAAALAPILFALIAVTGKDAMSEIDLSPDLFDPTRPEVLAYYQERAARIAHDVNAETEKQIRATVSQGVDAGDDDNAMRARIERVAGAALTYRADRIARTEVTRAQGFADTEAWRQSKVVMGKEVYTVGDERVCPFCGSLDGTIVDLDSNYFNLGDVYQVDGKTLNIDYDAVRYPPLHTSCRCRVLPVRVRVN